MKIYVVTHKKFNNELPKDYYYMQVNAANNEVFSELNDAVGDDNIAEKNPYYCELTASYWIWKNDKQSKIVGLAHYRRFLTTNRFSSSKKSFISGKKADRILKKYDFISTKQYKTDCTVKEHLLLNVHKKDFDLLREVVSNKYPDYIDEFDAVFSGHKSYLLNMFICKKELWDEYYSWLFSILSELEKFVDMTGYSVQEQRLYGFLAERLFSVYVNRNEYKVKSFPTCIVGVSKFKIGVEKIQKILHLKN